MDASQYQNSRTALLKQIDRLRTIRDELSSRDPIFINKTLPTDIRNKILLLDRDSSRLRNQDLTIAFVGGFSAGKSSLVNAFLGRYLLPESTKVTTAVPTFIRSTKEEEFAELHYLSETEIENLGEMFRKEIALSYNRPDLIALPFTSLIEEIKPLANEGRGRKLVEQFECFHEQRHQRRIETRGSIVKTSISDAQEKIRDEAEAMFLDRVVLNISTADIPTDTVLVDLPGISVPNPRHRDITFRFVREEAHAVIFVLMATRLFDKDEVEIMELFRSGQNKISEKTFWVLNRWDALSNQQQQQTIADFKNKMVEFSIPPSFQSFQTNALQGLLSQLGARNEKSPIPELQNHIKDYNEKLELKHSNSHETALHESQVLKLRETVIDFLNNRLRQTTLKSAFENTKINFSDPILSHLKREKDIANNLTVETLDKEEREACQGLIDERYQQRVQVLQEQLTELKNDVAVKRSALLIEHTNELIDKLREKIAAGNETDSYEIYKKIMSELKLRKCPYHFEIEIRIVDNLNNLFKREFISIVKYQVEGVFQELTQKIQLALEKVREDVNYNIEIMAPFDKILHEESLSFYSRVEGVVMTQAAQLDELLLYKPKSFLGLKGGNEILDGLEKAARMGFESFSNPGQEVQPDDFSEKTKRIRETLTSHYIGRLTEYHKRITQDIFPIVINNIQQIEKRLIDGLQVKYRPALEAISIKDVRDEFSIRRRELEDQSRRFRGLIEEIEQAVNEMSSIISGAKS